VVVGCATWGWGDRGWSRRGAGGRGQGPDAGGDGAREGCDQAAQPDGAGTVRRCGSRAVQAYGRPPSSADPGTQAAREQDDQGEGCGSSTDPVHEPS
jgi:hypothetical protein